MQELSKNEILSYFEEINARLATDDQYGTNDMEDSIFLMSLIGIKTEEDVFHIIDKYVDPFLRKPNVKFFAKEAFQRYTIKK